MKRERRARVINMRDWHKEMSDDHISMSEELDSWLKEEGEEVIEQDVPFESATSTPEEQYPRIEDLKEGDENFHLKARVAAIGKQMTGTSGTGKEWSMLTIHLNDDTSTIAMPLFNEEIDKADGLRINDWVIVKAWKVETYKNTLQLKLGKFGTLTRI